MKTELTLWLDDELICRAEVFAKANGKSLSQMVADYFALLATADTYANVQLTPTVLTLKNALRGANIDVEDYHNHLKDKYL